MADIKQHTSLGVTVFDPSPIYMYGYIYMNMYVGRDLTYQYVT